MSSDRISASAGLQGIGLPAATPGPADAALHGPAVRHGPAHGSLRKRKAAPDGESASVPPRVSIDALRHPKRQALPGPLQNLAFRQHVTDPASGRTLPSQAKLASIRQSGPFCGVMRCPVGCRTDSGPTARSHAASGAPFAD